MAWTAEFNVECANVAEAFLAWKDSAVTYGGMTVISSGDGSGGNFSGLAGGDILTVASMTDAVQNNIHNNDAWFRGQWPNGREIVVRMAGASTSQVCIAYSAAAGFTGAQYGSTAGGSGTDATVGASTPPSADDGVVIHVSTGDFITSTGVLMFPRFANGGISGVAVGRQVLHMLWGGADEDYAWYALSWQHGETHLGPIGGMFMDAVTNAPTARPDAMVIGTFAGSGTNPFSHESKMFNEQGYHTGYSGASGGRAYSWLTGVRTAAGGFGAGPPDPTSTKDTEMQSVHVMQFGSVGAPQYNLWDPNGIVVPADGIVHGTDATSGLYNTFGPAQWWACRYPYLGEPARQGYIGSSRLFRFGNTGDGMRDLSTDLNWRCIGGVWCRWDGVTGTVLV